MWARRYFEGLNAPDRLNGLNLPRSGFITPSPTMLRSHTYLNLLKAVTTSYLKEFTTQTHKGTRIERLKNRVFYRFDQRSHNRTEAQQSPSVCLRMAIDHYAILGLQHGATCEEIKKAHRKLALRCLPLPRPCCMPLPTNPASMRHKKPLRR